MANPHDIYSDKIVDLLRRFRTRCYTSSLQFHDPYDDTIMDTCIHLMKLDYECEVIENINGELCETYPKKIPIPINELGVGGKISHKSPLSKLVIPSSTYILVTTKRILNFDFPNDGNEKVVDTMDFINVSDLKSQLKLEEKSKEESIGNGAGAACSLENALLSCSDDSDIIQIKDLDEQKDSLENLSSVNLKTSPTFSSGNNKETKELSQPTGVNVAATEKDTISGEDLRIWLKDYLITAKKARCRDRFPIPSILCKGKFICRSATISCLIDVTRKELFSLMKFKTWEELTQFTNSLDRARRFDIELLKKLGVTTVMDLMVEYKKLKWGVIVSSSEKIDKEKRYEDFNLISVPYPGAEFFAEFTENNMNSANLHYNWSNPINNAPLSVPTDAASSKVCSDWNNYKDWDLRTITENYLKLILSYITDQDSMEESLLIHCISGWDRTPLFISLVRLSLWADGYIHTSLSSIQILYLTLAYDWYLFGHQLPERLKTNENILYFCFEFLEVLGNDAFMDISERRERHPSNGSSASGAYDSATEGNETTESSSFGSVTSLASSSSNPPASTSSAPNIKVSSLKSTTEAALWPFNNENFTFEDLSDPRANLSTSRTENTCDKTCKKNSPARSPLKEHNKSSPKSMPLSAGKRGSVRRGTLNGVLRELTPGKRSRKSSASSPGLKEGDRSSSDLSTDGFVNVSGSEVIHNVNQLKAASKPVPVPGRSRHNSSSSVGSWQMVSPPTPRFFDSPKSCCKTSFTAEMVDSNQTIREEVSPSSSVGSGQSITVFNRKERLSKVRQRFFKIENLRRQIEAKDKR
ncbi:Myotubularin-related protein 14 [Armadillidium nasatum]|uniref:Myotubularin-related protein 14 n=1 Tax=Armadillidium nasatum TaxID=96803 RepID=A0A5N5T4E0_9CRUS|nr:Myotubularin-related protein 14 [Armadillidium nasatum]